METKLMLARHRSTRPIQYMDPSGHFFETLFDIVSIGSSIYDLVTKPFCAAVGYLAWDIGATLLPGVPGSYVAKGTKLSTKGIKSVKGAKKVTIVSRAKSTLKSYNLLRERRRLRL